MTTIFKGSFVKTLNPNSIFVDGVAFAGDDWDEYTLAELMDSIQDDDDFEYGESNFDTGEEEGINCSYTQINTDQRVIIYVSGK